MALSDNNLNSDNYYKKHCVTSIAGNAYFVSMSAIPTTISGIRIPLPLFAFPSYNDICIFNNTDKIIEIYYKTIDLNSYTFKLMPGEYQSHHTDSFINNNVISVKSLNGSVILGSLDVYFNYTSIPVTTTNTSTSSSSSSSTTHTSTSTSSTSSTSTTTAPLFPGSLTTIAGWDSTALAQRVIVYLPDGYNSVDSKLYSWAIHLHSELEYGTANGVGGIERLYKSGPAKFLKEGDKPSEFIIICPQIVSGIWTSAKIDAVRSWAITNYKVDSTKLTVAGTSIGGTGTALYVATYPNKLANYIITTGSMGALSSPDTVINSIRPIDVPGYFLAGEQDSYINPYNGPNYLELANDFQPKPLYPFLVELIYSGAHTRNIWDDNVYNRKFRSDKVGSSKFDWIEDLAKKYQNCTSCDFVYNATKKVEVAETTLDLNKYLEALRLVKKLVSTTNKTALQLRLNIVLNNINIYNRNFIISFGSTPALNGQYNNIPSALLIGQSAPLIDIIGTPSSYTFSTTAINWTTTPSVVVGLQNDYLGFDYTFYETGFRCTGTNNTFRLNNLNSSNIYNLRVYFADKVSNSSIKTGGTITVLGNTKETLDPSFNTHRYIDFTNITALGGFIEFFVSSYVSNSYVDLAGIVLTEVIDS